MTDPSDRPGLGTRIGSCLGLLIVLSVGAVAFTWPLAQDLGGTIIGGPKDGSMFLWNLWWGAHAVFDLGASPLTTDHLFAPHGTSMAINTHAIAPAVLSAPLQAAFGLVTAFNLTLLATVVLSGLGAYLLAVEVTGSRRAGWVAACAFAFCHHRVSLMQFMNLAQTQWLALYAWALWAALRRRSFGFAALAGLFAALLGYSSYNLTVLAMAFTALVVAYGFLRDLLRSPARAKSLGRRALQVGLLGAVALALLAPLLLEMRREIAEHGDYTAMTHTSSYDEVSPLDRYVVRGPMARGGDGDERLMTRRASYVGWVVAGLALVGWLRHVRRGWSWLFLLTALGFLSASVGHQLVWSPGETPVGGDDPFAMPYAWLRDAPLLKELRIPHRYGVVGSLALAVLAAAGTQTLLRAGPLRRPAAGAAATAGLCALVFVDFAQLPFPKLYSLPEAPLEAFEAIRNDPRDCVVLEFPGGRTGYGHFSYFSTLHEKPVYLDGQVARRLRHLEPLQASDRLRKELMGAFYGRAPTRVQLARMKNALAHHVRQERIGWLILSWEGEPGDSKDWEHDKGLEARVRALNLLVREALPVAETLHRTTLKRVLEWEATSREERKSAPCLLGIYRLDIE